jgi:O-antigen ligase
MLQRSEMSAIGLMVLWTSFLTTLIIAPWAAYDPINLPKLLILSIGGFGCFAFLLTHIRELVRAPYRQVTILVAAFIVDLILVLFLSGNNFAKSFYGAHGRATGFIAYFVLAVLFLASVISASSRNFTRAAYFLVATGFSSIIYGIVQSIGADPVKWVNRQSPVIGFVGNPDFQSSLVGFSAVMVFALVLKARVHLILRGALIAYEAAALFVMKETEAQQGFIILIGGTFIVILIYLSQSKAANLTKPLLALSIGGLGFSIAGALNKGPLATLLHQDSVIFRGDYWRAGWKMTIEHPILGVGLDNYGDWYARSRSLAATLRRGADITSDSAHNVLLDLSSNGGFPLLVIYIMLLLFVVRSALRVLLRSESFDCYFAGVLAVWAAYQAQSIISINQLGLAVWGWVLSGLIIGWDIQSSGNAESKKLEPESRKVSTRNIDKSSRLTPTAILTFGVGLILGFVVAMPPLAASIAYKSARESGRVQTLIDSAYKKPLDVTRMGEVAIILSENQFERESISLITDAVKEFPDHYGIWAVMAELPGVPEEKVAEAKAQQKRLDPLNPDL